jgi:hypothetical protein
VLEARLGESNLFDTTGGFGLGIVFFFRCITRFFQILSVT